MCNNNRAEQAAALCKMYRERLQSIVTVNKSTTLAPICAEWITDHLSVDDYLKTTDDYLMSDFKLYYMMRRMNEFTYIDKKTDLPHKLTYTQQARLMVVFNKWRNWDVELFETALKGYSEKLQTN